MKNSKFKGNLVFASALVGLFSTCAISAHAEKIGQQGENMENFGLQNDEVVGPTEISKNEKDVVENDDDTSKKDNNVNEETDIKKVEESQEGQTMANAAFEKISELKSKASKFFEKKRVKKAINVANSTMLGTLAGASAYDLGKNLAKKMEESFRTLPENEIEQPQNTENSEENTEVNTQESNQGNQPGTKTENEKNTEENTEVKTQESNQDNQINTEIEDKENTEENKENTEENKENNSKESTQDNQSITKSESKQDSEIEFRESVEKKINYIVVAVFSLFIFNIVSFVVLFSLIRSLIRENKSLERKMLSETDMIKKINSCSLLSKRKSYKDSGKNKLKLGSSLKKHENRKEREDSVEEIEENSEVSD